MRFNRVATQIRLDETLYRKTRVSAESENRYISRQIEHFVRKGIEAYEKEHGPISLPEE